MCCGNCRNSFATAYAAIKSLPMPKIERVEDRFLSSWFIKNIRLFILSSPCSVLTIAHECSLTPRYTYGPREYMDIRGGTRSGPTRVVHNAR
ncbi:hypothetical protein J6590_017981 [Homalodisca vitripennis]|nr:hypothetical protein J6590_017981 [Homalodisca vitripennis]